MAQDVCDYSLTGVHKAVSILHASDQNSGGLGRRLYSKVVGTGLTGCKVTTPLLPVVPYTQDGLKSETIQMLSAIKKKGCENF